MSPARSKPAPVPAVPEIDSYMKDPRVVRKARAAAAPAAPRVPLSDAAYAEIRGRVVRCELAPGQRFTEKQLAAELGFGVTPVREALARLDNEGLVVTMPRKGYQVAPLTIKVVDDLFGVWRIVGPELVKLAVENMTQTQQQQIRQAFMKQRRIAKSRKLPPAAEWIGTAHESFLLLAQATGNDRLVEIYQRLSNEMARVFTMVYVVSPPREWFPGGEQDYVGALDKRDAALMSSLVRAFIERAHIEILKALWSWPSIRATEVVPPPAV